MFFTVWAFRLAVATVTFMAILYLTVFGIALWGVILSKTSFLIVSLAVPVGCSLGVAMVSRRRKQ
jgi:hypothetical protein